MSCCRMCPEPEIQMRIKEKLVHFFETDKRAKPDPNKMVKEFKRSAAGVELTIQSELRTFATLETTVNYLLTEVIRDKRKPFHYVYDFIFDRLRAIRQEIVVQDLNERQTILLLEPIIIFLAFANYELLDMDTKHFDGKICGQHLQECLKKALVCYDILRLVEKNTSISVSRDLVESIYLLYNLGSVEALNRANLLQHEDPNLKHSRSYQTSFSISKYLWQGNIFRALRLNADLPPLLKAVFSFHLPKLRGSLLDRLSHAYHSPNVFVPLQFLNRILCYNNDYENLSSDLTHYNVVPMPDGSLRFDKKAFNDKAVPKARKEFPLDLISL